MRRNIAATAARQALHRTAAAVYSCIPPASAKQVAVFRIALGAALAALVVTDPIDATWIPSAANGFTQPLERAFAGVLARNASVVDFITPWVLIAAALFVVGALSRLAYAALAAGVLTWGVVHAFQGGNHPRSALLLAAICLLPSRWGDCWSIDAWVRRLRGAPPRPPAAAREYGYTIWLPGFVFGVALAAAAVAKLRNSEGLAWILNGTVKYHFLTDAAQAPVDWGLALGLYPRLAVLVSLGAVAVELLVVCATLLQAYRWRAMAGLAATALLTGFYLFQGIVWPAWWVALLSFLPWHWIDARSRMPHGTPPERHSRWMYVHAAIVIAVVAQQVIVSRRRIEVDPVFSTYDMYSTTYESPEAYERASNDQYRFVARMSDNTEQMCVLDSADGEAMLAATLGAMETDAGRISSVLDDCFGSHADVERVDVEVARFMVDWSTWKPLGMSPVRRVGPLPGVTPVAGH